MDEDELKKDRAAINDFWDRHQSEDPFATSIEDAEKLSDLAWKYMSLYKQAVAENG